MLNLDLETQAKGVDVTLSVSGPMDQLKLTLPLGSATAVFRYRQVCSLPEKCPPLIRYWRPSQPPPPQQSFQQVGASAVLGQAVANPVSGPVAASVRSHPAEDRSRDHRRNQYAAGHPHAPAADHQTARFIYIQDVTQSNPQVIRVEWNINPTWTAVAERDIYGEFGVDVFYKKRFK